jgi:hypothetical protein
MNSVMGLIQFVYIETVLYLDSSDLQDFQDGLN